MKRKVELMIEFFSMVRSGGEPCIVTENELSVSVVCSGINRKIAQYIEKIDTDYSVLPYFKGGDVLLTIDK